LPNQKRAGNENRAKQQRQSQAQHALAHVAQQPKDNAQYSASCDHSTQEYAVTFFFAQKKRRDKHAEQDARIHHL